MKIAICDDEKKCLENAVNACMKLPPEERFIEIKYEFNAVNNVFTLFMRLK